MLLMDKKRKLDYFLSLTTLMALVVLDHNVPVIVRYLQTRLGCGLCKVYI